MSKATDPIIDRLVSAMNSLVFIHQLEVVSCPVHFIGLSRHRKRRQMPFYKTVAGRFGVKNRGTIPKVLSFALRLIAVRYHPLFAALSLIQPLPPQKVQGRRMKRDGIIRLQIVRALVCGRTAAVLTTLRFQRLGLLMPNHSHQTR
jgi:hypothetical protein